ncbi:MAG TPA: hypothetical protein VGH73_14815 [Thermoanaerobaculia bacterium]|jgi:hypothetical protein
MLVTWLGAILVVGGVLFTAYQAISRGRLSEPRRSRTADTTLEPRRPGGGFGIKVNWPGLAMIALGAVLLLASAAF